MKKVILIFFILIVSCGYMKIFYEESLIERVYIMDGE